MMLIDNNNQYQEGFYLLRKQLVGIIMTALVAVMLLSACSDNRVDQPQPETNAAADQGEQQQTDSGNTEAADTAPQSGDEAATREFEHGKGVSVIPVKPQRIIAVQYTGAMLALGVKPVGADNEWSVYPLLEEEWAGIEHVGDPWTGLNLEKIMSLEPDLIVTHVEATYDELAKIAPTLWIPWLQYSPPEQIALFGDILGKQEEAEQWQRQFESKVEQTKANVGSIIGPDETVSIVNIRPQNQFIYGNKAMGGYVIYELLGLNAPDIVRQEVLDQGLGQLEVSLELLPEYAGSDYIFLSVLESGGGAERAQEITGGSLWNGLPAAQSNKVVPLDWNTYFTTDPLSTMKQLDTFAELLNELYR